MNAPGTTSSRESIAELHRLRDDAARYRFWRSILLRRPDRRKGGAPTYSTVLATPADIDAEEFDRILDLARAQDDGARTDFTHGHVAPIAAPKVVRATAEKRPALPPIKCGCGAVRPTIRGRRPDEWTCGGCE